MYDQSQINAVRMAMPAYLSKVHGITNFKKAFRCVSPDHEDKHPSMKYNPQAYRVKCFACGASFDIIDLAGIDAGVDSFRDKVIAAASGAGITLDDIVPPCQPAMRVAAGSKLAPIRIESKPAQAENVIGAVEDASRALFEPRGASALSYLHTRGFDDTDIRRYEWGWAEHPRKIFPVGFEGAPICQDGYICLPFPTDEKWAVVSYATFRVCRNESRVKEWKRRGAQAPVWREYLLQGGVDTVCIAEGVYDAAALEILLNTPACAMCGDNITRVLDILADTSPSKRPLCVIATDCDIAGRKFANKLGDGLKQIGAAHVFLSDYPCRSKDACDVLQCRRTGHDQESIDDIDKWIEIEKRRLSKA